MDVQQIALVRASYARFVPHADVVGTEFYRCLFELNPAVRTLFASDLDTQIRRLMEMVRAVVDSLDDPDQLFASCRTLGQRYAGYGVQESHYDDVGMALLKALHVGLGAAYTDDVEAAWATVFGEMAETMIAAAQANTESA